MSVVHVTPGLLDTRAFTTFGLHAKPKSDNPIGKFGTGLKYAVATLVRLGCKVQVFIGETEYEFYTKASEFRGAEFSQVMMRKRNSLLNRWNYVELPYTTEHGRFWEPWQAFRELHSNTLDEGGETFMYRDSAIYGEKEQTKFVISGEPYEQAFMDRDQIFLPHALTKREGDDRVQVFNEPSNHLYWRGIRVFDLEKPSIYTYNVLEDLELTEDRTIKYLWSVQSKIAAYVARSKDRKLISSVISADVEKFFEGRLDWDYTYATPTEEFKEVVSKKRFRGSYVAPRALAYYDRYSPPAPKALTLRDRIAAWAYEATVPEELQELLKHLLKCEIKEPETVDDGLPF